MSKLIMMIGLASSGKSTQAEMLSKKNGAMIYSSDGLRMELYGTYNDFRDNDGLFKELHKRIIKKLNEGYDVIYDDANLSMKKRRYFLSLLHKGIEREAVVVATTVGDCLVRDSKRNKKVGEKVIVDMWKRFQFPLEQEGFDSIQIIYNSEIHYAINSYNYFRACENFNQDNPNHAYNLFQHMVIAFYESKEEPYSIRLALAYHDVGKLWTKGFKNAKGEPTEIAHYYQHENVGSYQSMFTIEDSFEWLEEEIDKLYIL